MGIPSADPRGFQKDPEMLALIDAYVKEYGTFQSGGCVGTCYWFVLKDAIDSTQSVDVDIIKAYLGQSTKPGENPDWLLPALRQT